MLRTPSFLIKDLKTAKLENGFVQKGIKFSDVHLCGAITKIKAETTKDSTKIIFIFTLTDHSGSIDCIFDPPPENTLDPLIELDIENLKNADLKDPLIGFCVANQTRKRLKGHDFKLGMWVKIVGQLQHEKGVKYINIEKIHKMDNLKQRINYFKDMLYMYNNIYNKT